MSASLILDIDGTLVDSNYQHALAWYAAFREHDIVVPLWRLHRHLGMGGDQLVEAVAGAPVEAELGEELRSAHDALYLATIETVSAIAGAREFLTAMREQGRVVVLASSAKDREVDFYIDLLDARHLVAGWTTAADVEQTKPEPDLVHAALEKLGEETATMVGDTPWDIKAALRAGVPTIAVLTGGFAASELHDAGAAAVCESVAELRERPELLDALAAGAPRTVSR